MSSSLGVQPFPHRAAGMDQSKLFLLISGDLDQCCLQGVKNHAEGRGAGGTLAVVFIGFLFYILF